MGKVSFHNDHGLLSGLADDDHPQYALRSILTTLGDIVYAGVAAVWTRLAGNITTTKKFLTQTGTGAASASPSWEIITSADLPASVVETTDADWIDLTDGGVTALHSHAGVGGHTIRENGTDQTARTGLNFIDSSAGAGLITDDAGNNETEVNLDLYLLASGSRAMTGDLDMGGNDLFNVRNYYPDPGGRLTLTTATPVMTAEAANQTTIYYTPYKHDLVPLYDGTNWDVHRFTELSIAMAASVNWVANSNYDCFIYNDGGTLRLVTGPAWTSNTSRGTGAGTTELVRLNGRWVNNVSMTGRYGASSTVTVGANLGLYVGTIHTTVAGGTTTWELGGAAAGGDPGILYVWNMYNRVFVYVLVKDSTDSWTYSGTDAWRALNNSATNRVTYISGQAEDFFKAYNGILCVSSAGGNGWTGIGYDSTTALSGWSVANILGTTQGGAFGGYATTSLGLHFMSAIEYENGTSTETFYGDLGNPAFIQNGFEFTGYF